MRPVAIITGASSGIGVATAHELARCGYALVLAARSVVPMQQLAGELTQRGAPSLAVPTDVTRAEDIRRLVRLTLERFGRIDVLINNAGISIVQSTEVTDVPDPTLNTNLLAPIQLTHAVVPTMLAQRSGHIINIGSVAGHIGTPGNARYAASKFGLRGYSEAVRRELRPQGVHVSLVSPGFIRTPMTSSLRFPMPGPEIVARAVSSLLLRPRREMVVPSLYRPLIWLNDVLPGFVDGALIRFGDVVRW